MKNYILLFLIVIFFIICTPFKVICSENGSHLLIDAAAEGNIREMDKLIERGIKVDSPEEEVGMTALMAAALFDKTQSIVFLLNKGANIHARSKVGQTALMYAARIGSSKTIQILLDNKSDIHVRDYDFGITPLMMASIYNNVNAIKTYR